MTDQVSIRSLDEIMSREPATAETVQEPNNPASPETDGQGTQPRDEAGKFAPKAENAPGADGNADQMAQAAVEAGKPEPGHVPLQALHAEREKGKAARDRAEQLERQNAELIAALTRVQPQSQPQPAEKPKPKNFWESPDEFLAERTAPIQQEAVKRHMMTSRMLAEDKFGAEAVDEADKALGALMQANQNDPEVIAMQQRVASSPHPYRDLVTWHQRRKAMADIGDDPTAYEAKVRERILAEIAAANPVPSTQQPPVARPNMPSNFASARNEGPRSAVTYSGPRPLSEITKGSAQ